jgi:hypothetical protein
LKRKEIFSLLISSRSYISPTTYSKSQSISSTPVTLCDPLTLNPLLLTVEVVDLEEEGDLLAT